MHPDKFLGRKASTEKPSIHSRDRAEQMISLNTTIAGKRTDAVSARSASGIEDVWMQCEEATIGIDDSNRHEFSNAKWSKPTSMVGPVTSGRSIRDDSRSNAFVLLTARYVFGASAKLCEIILPVDDKAFSIKPMPDPDLTDQAKDTTPLVAPNHQPIMVAPTTAPTPSPLPGQPQGHAPAPQPQQMTGGDVAQAQLDAATESAEKAETRIYGWMKESKYPAEARKIIGDGARIGVGILKGPYPDYKKSKALSKEGGKVKLTFKKKIIPKLCWVDPWNIFPDDACGEDIHNGDFIFERDFLSAKKLRALKDSPGYLGDQIDKVLREGPGKVYAENNSPSDNEKNKRKRFEIWYYYGTIKRDEMDLLNPDEAEDIPDDQDEVYAIISMVNDTIIRAIINPLDSGTFPYRVFSWSRRPGHWAGKGVAESMLMPQKSVNAATRALFNNAGISAGPQIVVDQSGIVPADGNWKMTPNKFWYKTSDVGAIANAFEIFNVPSVEKEMMAIIDYGMKLAEESTGIPLVTQGQTGPSSPETFGAAELQDNNAHTWLRDVGAGWDDQIGEPIVDALYEWLLLDDDVPDDEKAEYEINAQGSTAMVERAIQEGVMMGLLKASENPQFRLDPKKLMAEYLRGKRIDPNKVQFTKEEQDKMDQQPPSPPIQVQVATLNNQGKIQAVQAKAQADSQLQQQELAHDQQQLQSGGAAPHVVSAQAKIMDAQIKARSAETIEQTRAAAEQAYANTEAQIARDNHNAQIQELQMKRELALLEYANQQKMSLDDIRAQLSKTAMVEQTRRQVAAADMQARATENETDRAHDMTKHLISVGDNAAARADQIPSGSEA